jgi:hypothetical protein
MVQDKVDEISDHRRKVIPYLGLASVDSAKRCLHWFTWLIILSETTPIHWMEQDQAGTHFYMTWRWSPTRVYIPTGLNGAVALFYSDTDVQRHRSVQQEYTPVSGGPGQII